jgi:2-polyprenyl-3-methyl-5-hydroxy-6-metoxy-1,4-benzoquinol methylase
MIDAAHKQLSRFGKQPNLEWLPSNSGKGAYEQEHYDIVLCLSVLEFVPDISSLLFRLCSRVNRGGILVLSVPNRQSWLRAIEHFIYRHPQKFRQFSVLDHLTGSDSYLNYQAHQFTRKQLSGMVQQNGLREEARRFHAAPLFRSIDHFAPVGMMLMMTFRK